MKHNFTRPVKNGIMITASLTALAFVPGCTWLNDVASDWPPQSKEQQKDSTQQARTPQTRSADSPGAMTEPQREYRYTQMPEQPDPQQRSRANNNMAAPQGLRVDQSQQGRGAGRTNAANDRQLRQRLSRIEQQLTMLRRDFADIRPVMRKVQAAEDQIHQLSRELSQIDGAGGTQSGSQTGRSGDQAGQSARARQQHNADRSPMTWQQARQRAEQQARQRRDGRKQSYQKQQTSQPSRADRGGDNQKQADGAYIKDVRTGTFKGNTRLVLDLSQPAADFSYDLDNREGLLVVEIEGAGWRAVETQDMPDSDVISSISASTTRQGGARMVVELSRDAEVVRAQALPPTGNNGHRIFMDLAAE